MAEKLVRAGIVQPLATSQVRIFNEQAELLMHRDGFGTFTNVPWDWGK